MKTLSQFRPTEKSHDEKKIFWIRNIYETELGLLLPFSAIEKLIIFFVLNGMTRNFSAWKKYVMEDTWFFSLRKTDHSYPN